MCAVPVVRKVGKITFGAVFVSGSKVVGIRSPEK